jgi:MFS family permease
MIGLSWLYVLTLYFQEVLGHGPLAARLLFAPMTVSSVPAALVAGRLVTRFGVRPVAATGLVLIGSGVLLMTLMSEAGGLLFVFSGMVVGETGFMFSNVPLTIAATGGVDEDERGLASGLVNTSIQLGNAFGLAAVATVVAAVAASGGARISSAVSGRGSSFASVSSPLPFPSYSSACATTELGIWNLELSIAWPFPKS